MMRLLFALFAVLLASNVAFAFQLTVPDQTFVVSSGGSREIRISVSSARDDKILLDLVDETPWMTLSASQIEVKAGESKEAVLYVSPFHTTSPGLYKVVLAAESAFTREKKTKDIFISVTRGEGVEIEKIEVSGNLEPLGFATIKFIIKNLASVSVKDLSLIYTINSPSTVISEERETINLAPEGSALVEKTYNFAAGEEAGEYAIKTELVQNAKVLDSTEQKFTIPKKAVIRQTLDEKTGLFRREQTITLANFGNEADSVVITGRVSRFDSYFFTGTPPTSIADDIYFWEIRNLEPGESRTISYALDFTPFYLFLIALALLSWFFLVRLRIVRIKKFIMQKKEVEEGEEFTVGLEIANKTGKMLEATVKDFVPLVFDIKDTEGPKPARKKIGSGTELSWKIKNFHKDEVRILTYKIIPTFGVHGSVRLPRATVTYPGRKKDVELLSGIATIGVEAEEEKLHHRVEHHVKRHAERIKRVVKRK